MSALDDIEREPYRFDFFDTMRRIERQAGPPFDSERRASARSRGEAGDVLVDGGRPRIGDAASRRDEYAFLGQDPYFAFPASNLSKFESKPDEKFKVLVKFLGLLGPMGALPLAISEESYGWLLDRDDAFPRFLDIFNHRFLQLFFRAWADARPAVQHDRPNQDRFIAYVGSTIGIGSTPFIENDTIADTGKLGFAGLLGAKAKSASRLRGAIRGLFRVEAEIDQFVGSRLELAADDRTLLGQSLCGLGVDTMIGASFYSVQDKIRIRIFVEDLDRYRRFLPEGDMCEPLVDLVYFFLGEELDWDVELALPASKAPPLRLGQSAALGWTSWLSPNLDDPGYRTDARFHAADRIRRRRTMKSDASKHTANAQA